MASYRMNKSLLCAYSVRTKRETFFLIVDSEEDKSLIDNPIEVEADNGQESVFHRGLRQVIESVGRVSMPPPMLASETTTLLDHDAVRIANEG
jgi:hypothetical protein